MTENFTPHPVVLKEAKKILRKYGFKLDNAEDQHAMEANVAARHFLKVGTEAAEIVQEADTANKVKPEKTDVQISATFTADGHDPFELTAVIPSNQLAKGLVAWARNMTNNGQVKALDGAKVAKQRRGGRREAIRRHKAALQDFATKVHHAAERRNEIEHRARENASAAAFEATRRDINWGPDSRGDG